MISSVNDKLCTIRSINEKNIEMNKKFRSRKQIYNLNLKDYIDFSPCINISKYN